MCLCVCVPAGPRRRVRQITEEVPGAASRPCVSPSLVRVRRTEGCVGCKSFQKRVGWVLIARSGSGWGGKSCLTRFLHRRALSCSLSGQISVAVFPRPPFQNCAVEGGPGRWWGNGWQRRSRNCWLQLDLVTDSVKTKISEREKVPWLGAAADFLGCERVRNQSCPLMREKRI